MPSYGYTCPECKHEEDEFFRISEEIPEEIDARCISCGKDVTKSRAWGNHLPMIGQVYGAGNSPARTRRRKGARGA